MSERTDYVAASAKGQLRKGWDDLNENGQLGDWAFMTDAAGVRYLLFRSPDGTERGWLSHIPLSPEAKPGPVWQWDGNEAAPTITPSIHRMPSWNKPGWHGWMRQGELVCA